MNKQQKIDKFITKLNPLNEKNGRENPDNRMKISMSRLCFIKDENISFEEFLEFTNVRDLIEDSLRRRHPKTFILHLKYVNEYAKQIYNSCQTDPNYLSKTKTFQNLQYQPKPWLTQNDWYLISKFNIKRKIRVDICKNNVLKTKNNILDLWVELSKYYNMNEDTRLGLNYLNNQLKKHTLYRLEKGLEKKVLKLRLKKPLEARLVAAQTSTKINENTCPLKCVKSSDKLKKNHVSNSNTLINKNDKIYREKSAENYRGAAEACEPQNVHTYIHKHNSIFEETKKIPGPKSKTLKKEKNTTDYNVVDSEIKKKPGPKSRTLKTDRNIANIKVVNPFQELSENIEEGKPQSTTAKTNIDNELPNAKILNSLEKTPHISRKISILKEISVIETNNKSIFKHAEAVECPPTLKFVKSKPNLIKEKLENESKTFRNPNKNNDLESHFQEMLGSSIIDPDQKTNPSFINGKIMVKLNNNSNFPNQEKQTLLKEAKPKRWKIPLSKELSDNEIYNNKTSTELLHNSKPDLKKFEVFFKKYYKLFKRCNIPDANEEIMKNVIIRHEKESQKKFGQHFSNNFLTKNHFEKDEDCHINLEKSKNKINAAEKYKKNKEKASVDLNKRIEENQYVRAEKSGYVENSKVDDLQILNKNPTPYITKHNANKIIRNNDKNIKNTMNLTCQKNAEGNKEIIDSCKFQNYDEDKSKPLNFGEIPVKKEHDTQYPNYFDEMSVLPTETDKPIKIEHDETEDVNKMLEEMMSVSKTGLGSFKQISKIKQNINEKNSRAINTNFHILIPSATNNSTNIVGKSDSLEKIPENIYILSDKSCTLKTPEVLPTSCTKNKKNESSKFLKSIKLNGNDFLSTSSALRLNKSMDKRQFKKSIQNALGNENDNQQTNILLPTREKNAKIMQSQNFKDDSQFCNALGKPAKANSPNLTKKEEHKTHLILNSEKKSPVNEILPSLLRTSEVKCAQFSQNNIEGTKYFESAINKNSRIVKKSKIKNAKIQNKPYKKVVIKFGGRNFLYTDKLKKIIKRRSILYNHAYFFTNFSLMSTKILINKKQLIKGIIQNTSCNENGDSGNNPSDLRDLSTTFLKTPEKLEKLSVNLFTDNPEHGNGSQLCEHSKDSNKVSFLLSKSKEDSNQNTSSFNFEKIMKVDDKIKKKKQHINEMTTSIRDLSYTGLQEDFLVRLQNSEQDKQNLMPESTEEKNQRLTDSVNNETHKLLSSHERMQIQRNNTEYFNRTENLNKNLLKELNDINSIAENRNINMAEISIKKEHDTQYSNYFDEVSILSSEEDKTIVIEDEGTEDVNKMLAELMSSNEYDTITNSLSFPEFKKNGENKILSNINLSSNPNFSLSVSTENRNPIETRTQPSSQEKVNEHDNLFNNKNYNLQSQRYLDNPISSKNYPVFKKAHKISQTQSLDLFSSNEENSEKSQKTEHQHKAQLSELSGKCNEVDFGVLKNIKDNINCVSFSRVNIEKSREQNNVIIKEIPDLVVKPASSTLPNFERKVKLSVKPTSNKTKNEDESIFLKNFQNVDNKAANSQIQNNFFKNDVIKFGGRPFLFTDKLQKITKKRNVMLDKCDSSLISAVIPKRSRNRRQLIKKIMQNALSNESDDLLLPLPVENSTNSRNAIKESVFLKSQENLPTQSHSNEKNKGTTPKLELQFETQLSEVLGEPDVVDPLMLTITNDDTESPLSLNFEKYFIADDKSQDTDNQIEEIHQFSNKFSPIMQCQEQTEIPFKLTSINEEEKKNFLKSLNKSLQNIKNKPTSSQVQNNAIKKDIIKFGGRSFLFTEKLKKITKRNVLKRKLSSSQLSKQKRKSSNSQNTRKYPEKLSSNESFALQERHKFPSLQIILNRGNEPPKVIKGQHFPLIQLENTSKATSENHYRKDTSIMTNSELLNTDITYFNSSQLSSQKIQQMLLIDAENRFENDISSNEQSTCIRKNTSSRLLQEESQRSKNGKRNNLQLDSKNSFKFSFKKCSIQSSNIENNKLIGYSAKFLENDQNNAIVNMHCLSNSKNCIDKIPNKFHRSNLKKFPFIVSEENGQSTQTFEMLQNCDNFYKTSKKFRQPSYPYFILTNFTINEIDFNSVSYISKFFNRNNQNPEILINLYLKFFININPTNFSNLICDNFTIKNLFNINNTLWLDLIKIFQSFEKFKFIPRKNSDVPMQKEEQVLFYFFKSFPSYVLVPFRFSEHINDHIYFLKFENCVKKNEKNLSKAVNPKILNSMKNYRQYIMSKMEK